MLRTIAIVQARMGSTRLPGKVLLPLGKKPVLQWVIERTRAIFHDVVIATTEEEADNPIAYLGWELETPVVRYGTGEATSDVFTRFRRVLEQFPCDAFVRVTADCPMIEPDLLCTAVTVLAATGAVDCWHLDASVRAGFADGLDCEVVFTPAFMDIRADVLTASDREHVTTIYSRNPQICRSKTLGGSLVAPYMRDPKRYRLTLDTQRDYERLQRIWAEVPHGPHGPDTLKALQWLDQHPEWWGDHGA